MVRDEEKIDDEARRNSRKRLVKAPVKSSKQLGSYAESLEIGVHVNTTGELVETGRRRRRTHSAHFKAEAVGACQQPGISVAAVALARGLNAAMLHRCVKQAERSGSKR